MQKGGWSGEAGRSPTNFKLLIKRLRDLHKHRLGTFNTLSAFFFFLLFKKILPFVTWQQPSKCCRRCMKSQSGEELCFHAGKDKSFHCWSPAMLNPGAVASGLLWGLSLWPGWLAAMCPKAPRVPQVSLSTALPCWEHRKVEMRKTQEAVKC